MYSRPMKRSVCGRFRLRFPLSPLRLFAPSAPPDREVVAGYLRKITTRWSCYTWSNVAEVFSLASGSQVMISCFSESVPWFNVDCPIVL
jgi:hypothetical protein